MNDSLWAKIRHLFPYRLLVFRPAREFTLSEITAIAERAGLHLDVRLERNP